MDPRRGYRALRPAQFELISTVRVRSEMVALAAPFPDASRTHITSPTLNVLLLTLFEETDEVVPLENPGFSPKNTFTLLLHDERIETDTVVGADGADGARALGAGPVDGGDERAPS